MSTRKFNFFPGPASVPTPVLERYQEEFLDFEGIGASFMELSHRSAEVVDCHNRSISKIRKLMGVGEEFHILLLPGGTIGQFAGIPMNIAGPSDPATVAVTGHWSKTASVELARYCELSFACNTLPNCNTIPDPKTWKIADNSKFVLIVDNETIHGVEYPSLPDVGDIPLVVDQSSNIFSRPFDMTKVGVLVACLQKNLGPAGLTVVAARKDICKNPQPITPGIWNYNTQARLESMYNTIPTFQLRMMEMCLDWINDKGGLETLGKLNQEKATMIYDYIDSEDFYTNKVEKEFRSKMSVPFHLADAALDASFLEQAVKHDLIGLKGHRVTGGMRASIYNAMPKEGVVALISFMKEFVKNNG